MAIEFTAQQRCQFELAEKAFGPDQRVFRFGERLPALCLILFGFGQFDKEFYLFHNAAQIVERLDDGAALVRLLDYRAGFGLIAPEIRRSRLPLQLAERVFTVFDVKDNLASRSIAP